MKKVQAKHTYYRRIKLRRDLDAALAKAFLSLEANCRDISSDAQCNQRTQLHGLIRAWEWGERIIPVAKTVVLLARDPKLQCDMKCIIALEEAIEAYSLMVEIDPLR